MLIRFLSGGVEDSDIMFVIESRKREIATRVAEIDRVKDVERGCCWMQVSDQLVS
jgi:hypothetical protein